MGENLLQDSFRPQHTNKLTKPVVIILVVWFMAMGSLIGVHYFLKRKPQINKAGILKIHAKYNSLSDEEKIRMKYFESGIIELANGELCIVDSSFNDARRNPAGGRGLAGRKIEFQVDDPLFLERQMMIKEAFKTLNKAEKRCLTDGHAVIVFENGAYYLIIDAKIYAEYVLKHGTECGSCGKKRSNQ